MEPITFAEVAVLDANSEYRGVSTAHLMEMAGKGVADHVLSMGGAGKRVLFVCGTGNNGGDGFVAARHLAGKAKAEVVLLRSRDQVRTEIARTNLRRLDEAGVPLSPLAEVDIAKRVAMADIVVDAMLGVGIIGVPRSPYAELITLLNESGKPVISVDVPSGWGTELAVRPNSTVTFHAPKVGMGTECGKIVVKPIGVPEEAVSYAGPGELTLVPPVSREAHKGERGNVLVVGGGPYTGAPALAAMAAHRAGTDLVYVAVPGAIADVVRGFSMDLIVRAVGTASTDRLAPEHMEAALAAGERAHAVVLGPGLGPDPGSVELAALAYRRLADKGTPVVVDADALKAFKDRSGVPRHTKAVLTPHAGELAAIAGGPLPKALEDRAEAVRALAGELGCTILAKGPVDVVSDGVRVKLNDNGNAAMATGGTGDVLSGVTGAFLAKGMDAFDAARAAVFAVCSAGDDALAELGHSLVATDVLSRLPGVLSRHIEWWGRR